MPRDTNTAIAFLQSSCLWPSERSLKLRKRASVISRSPPWSTSWLESFSRAYLTRSTCPFEPKKRRSSKRNAHTRRNPSPLQGMAQTAQPKPKKKQRRPSSIKAPFVVPNIVRTAPLQKGPQKGPYGKENCPNRFGV